MNAILVTLASIALAGLIISPFFWLRFLKMKSVAGYLVGSSVTTLILFWISLTGVYNFILKYVNSYNVLGYFDNIFLGYASVVLFFIVLSPFIFTKIIKHKFTFKNFFLALFLSVVIFASIFTYWALVLLPEAFGNINDYI